MNSGRDSLGGNGQAGSEHFRKLSEELYRERVEAARKMSPEEKLLAGEELFEYACAITLAGIQNQFPNANEQECRDILRQRLKLRKRMEHMERKGD